MATVDQNDSQAKQTAARRRAEDGAFARWAEGYGVIRHSDVTQAKILELESRLSQSDIQGDGAPFYERCMRSIG
jgi:hypothetical protein